MKLGSGAVLLKEPGRRGVKLPPSVVEQLTCKRYNIDKIKNVNGKRNH